MQSPNLLAASPLGSILDDIKRAIDARLYYPALLVSLTIPEICMALTLDKSVFVKEFHYAEFVDKYAKLGIGGKACYRLRGGVVHRADMTGHPLFEATHVVFTIPETTIGATQIGFHAITMMSNGKKAFAFDLSTFCNAMISAASRWYDDHHSDPQVTENIHNLIRYCPAGLLPFVGGMPIVASGK